MRRSAAPCQVDQLEQLVGARARHPRLGGRDPQVIAGAAARDARSPRASPRPRAGGPRAPPYGRPAIVAVPEVGVTSPSSERSVVVFPEPLGPRKPAIVPASIEKLRSSTARTGPKLLASDARPRSAPSDRHRRGLRRLARLLGFGRVGGGGGRSGVSEPIRGSHSSQLGRYQFQSPSTFIDAGSSTPRTIVASISTATARPTPSSFRSMKLQRGEDREDAEHDEGGAGHGPGGGRDRAAGRPRRCSSRES